MALEVDAIHTYYGESHVLHGISLRVDPGEVLAILGRNGMGKTTLIRSIVGFTPPREGHVRYKGVDITRRPPFRMVDMGMALVPQGRRVFPSLSVRENLEVARRTWGDTGATPWTEERVFDFFPHLRALKHRHAGRLSGGEQQMLTIARTLMGSPDVLLLDEPSEGLAPLVVEMLRAQLARLKESGLTMILAEQNVRFVSGLGERVYILEKGMVRYQGSMAAFLADEDVRQAYLAL